MWKYNWSPCGTYLYSSSVQSREFGRNTQTGICITMVAISKFYIAQSVAYNSWLKSIINPFSKLSRKTKWFQSRSLPVYLWVTGQYCFGSMLNIQSFLKLLVVVYGRTFQSGKGQLPPWPCPRILHPWFIFFNNGLRKFIYYVTNSSFHQLTWGDVLNMFL
jgi:hypothetical protein